MSKTNGDKSGLLSVCRKAGKLKSGMDIVKSACENGEAAAVFIARDISPRSLKEIRYCCMKNSVKIYRLSMTIEQIANAIGKAAGILAATDCGFAKALSDCGVQDISVCEDEFYSK